MEKKNIQNVEDLCLYYRNGIMEKVVRIKNPGKLEYLYAFISLFFEKWG